MAMKRISIAFTVNKGGYYEKDIKYSFNGMYDCKHTYGNPCFCTDLFDGV